VTTTKLLLQEVSSLVLLDNHSNIPTMGTSRCTISHRDFIFFFSSLKQLQHLKLACLADFLLPEVLQHHPFTPLPSRTFQERLGNVDCKGTAESLPRALTRIMRLFADTIVEERFSQVVGYHSVLPLQKD
jgi:hypothetical protein